MDDEDQMLNKGDRILRRKEELERLLSRARNYRQYLTGGCQVSLIVGMCNVEGWQGELDPDLTLLHIYAHTGGSCRDCDW